MKARTRLIVVVIASLGWSTGCGLTSELDKLFNSGGTGGGDSSATGSGTGGASSSSSTGTGLLCVVSAPCPDGAACCAGAAVLTCNAGTLTEGAACEDGETCDSSSPSCACEPGAKRCSGTQAEVCQGGPEGPYAWVGHACPSGCEQGACVGTACTLGELGCGDAEGSVVECKPIPEDQVTDQFPVADCAAMGFENGCSALPPGILAAAPGDLCINACNVRGAPLDELLCAHPKTPGLPCAVLVCNADGTGLVPDHVSCLAPGIHCEKDSECASCSCKDGLCFGPTVQHCGPAKGVCP